MSITNADGHYVCGEGADGGLFAALTPDGRIHLRGDSMFTWNHWLALSDWVAGKRHILEEGR